MTEDASREPTISVLINTLNEERDLPRAIASVATWTDEIIVVDMNSDDRTVQIAKSLGAEVHMHPRADQVAVARGFGISKATGAWLLILDADELVPPALARQLLAVAREGKGDAFRLPFQNYFIGRAMKGCGYGPTQDYHERFFRRGAIEARGEVHNEFGARPGFAVETIQYDGENAIHHFSYVSAADFVERINRYTSLEVKRSTNKGPRGRGAVLRRSFRAVWKRGFAMKGWKDGWQGFYLSLMYGFYEALVQMKTHEASEFTNVEAVQASYQETAARLLSGAYPSRKAKD